MIGFTKLTTAMCVVISYMQRTTRRCGNYGTRMRYPIARGDTLRKIFATPHASKNHSEFVPPLNQR